MERTETQRKILEIGKREFLEKGFKDASLNKIVAEAGFTKGAFYGYYPDKTALFEDLVGETAKELLTRFKAAQDDYFDLVPEGKAKDSLALSTQHLHEFVAFMYDHFDEFKLILCCSEGTRFSGLVDEMVEIEVEATHAYQIVLRELGRPSPRIDPKLEHILITGMFHTFFELIIHEMPLPDAENYLNEMRAFYTAGWMKIMGQ